MKHFVCNWALLCCCFENDEEMCFSCILGNSKWRCKLQLSSVCCCNMWGCCRVETTCCNACVIMHDYMMLVLLVKQCNVLPPPCFSSCCNIAVRVDTSFFLDISNDMNEAGFPLLFQKRKKNKRKRQNLRSEALWRVFYHGIFKILFWRWRNVKWLTVCRVIKICSACQCVSVCVCAHACMCGCLHWISINLLQKENLLFLILSFRPYF